MSTALSVLAYSVAPGTKRVIVLCWRHHATSFTQSSKFFASTNCVPLKDEPWAETAARAFSAATRGIFSTANRDKKDAPDLSSSLADNQAADIRKKLKKNKGVGIVSSSSARMVLLPVRFVPSSWLCLPGLEGAEGAWVFLDELVRACKLSAQVVNTMDGDRELPLYLGFRALLNQDSALQVVREVIADSGLDMGHTEVSEAEIIQAAREEEVKKEQSNVSMRGPLIHYSCRTCRHPLFSNGDLEEPHESPAVGLLEPHKSIKIKGRRIDANQSLKCKSLVLQNNDTLRTVFGPNADLTEDEGNLTCPKCTARLGAFKWAGDQCSCGEWISPYIHVILSKVDEKKPLAVRPVFVRKPFVPRTQ